MNSGRVVIVVILLCSLTFAGLTRQLAQVERAHATSPLMPGVPARSVGATDVGVAAGTSISGMDTYALALLLGGLRGPLVMFLWTSSENQKQAHDLADFDTKVEWIRMLQPEFDTVHLFQIWNKAYNISAQLASLPNKYTTVLDAFDYGKSVDRQKPDDLNILTAIGSLFADKLGDSTESAYYTRRVREESQALVDLVRVTVPTSRLPDLTAAAHRAGMDQSYLPVEDDVRSQTSVIVVTTEVGDQLRKTFTGPDVVYDSIKRSGATIAGDAGVKRERLDPMLDGDGHVLAKDLEATYPRPANVAPDAPWYDGSMLQFLKAYEPFPYGLSPRAIGYDYFERCRMLMTLAHQSHIQTSDMVVDGRPGMELTKWGEEEGDVGRRAELRLFGIDDSGQKHSLDEKSPEANFARPVRFEAFPITDPAAAAEALYSYGLAARLYDDSAVMFRQHVRDFPRTTQTYASHIDDAVAYSHFFKADRAYLAGHLTPAERDADFATAVDEYNKAMQAFAQIVLRYYIDDDVARQVYPVNGQTGRSYSKATISLLQPEIMGPLLQRTLDANELYYHDQKNIDQYSDDREQYLAFIRRCGTRLAALGHPTLIPLERDYKTVIRLLQEQQRQGPPGAK